MGAAVVNDSDSLFVGALSTADTRAVGAELMTAVGISVGIVGIALAVRNLIDLGAVQHGIGILGIAVVQILTPDQFCNIHTGLEFECYLTGGEGTVTSIDAEVAVPREIVSGFANTVDVVVV